MFTGGPADDSADESTDYPLVIGLVCGGVVIVGAGLAYRFRTRLGLFRKYKQLRGGDAESFSIYY